MSIHPSLAPLKGNKHRSVHKRFERIEEMRKQSKWPEGTSPFGLPKGKIVRVKLVKKAKAAANAGAEGAAAPAAGAAAPTKGKGEAK